MSNVVPLASPRARGWNRVRWDWAEAVCRAAVPQVCKSLAYVLIAQYAHHETADCHPGAEALADSLGTTPRTVRRAIADLEAAGFLARGPGGYSGAKVAILFRLGGRPLAVQPHEKADDPDRQKADDPDRQKADDPDRQFDPERRTILTGKADNPGCPPRPPYKAEPNFNQKDGAVQDGHPAVPKWLAETAEKIRTGGYVAPSTLTPAQARLLLAHGLVLQDDLRRMSISF